MLGAEGEEILENNFLRDAELEDKNVEETKEEHEFDKIKDAFDMELFCRYLIFSMMGNI